LKNVIWIERMLNEQPCDQEHAGRLENDPGRRDKDDWELVHSCLSEKDRFFPLLVKRHFALVFNIGYRFFLDRETAEDVAQEVFLKVYDNIEDLQAGKQPFVHWLCRITTNSCRSFYRKKRSENQAVSGGKVDFWYQDDVERPIDRIDDETKATIEYVNDALKRIKPNERIVLVLTHIAELKTGDIAPMIKMPEYTVRRLLRRGEKKIRKIIAQKIIK
jgi:RNA polymerase sigma factor (sigma-70 family)